MINENFVKRVIGVLLEIAQTPQEWARARDAGSAEKESHTAAGKPKRTQSFLKQRKAEIQKRIVGGRGAEGGAKPGKHEAQFLSNPQGSSGRRGFGNLKRS